jgi:hypothetical protein
LFVDPRARLLFSNASHHRRKSRAVILSQRPTLMNQKKPFLAHVVLLLVCAAPLAIQTGCATVLKGTHQDIPVASDPSRASILVDGVRQGTTPASLNLPRKKSHVVTLELEGYESESVTLKPSIGGAVAGNIIAGGIIGWGVDASTGAQYNLNPDSINIRLRPRTPAVAQQRSDVDEMLRELSKLESLRSDGKLSDDEYSKLRTNVLRKYQ